MHKQLHISFLEGFIAEFSKKYSLEAEAASFCPSLQYAAAEHLSVSAIYWALIAASMLNYQKQLISADCILSFLYQCYCPDQGGFAGAPGHDCHIVSTLNACQIYHLLGVPPPNAAAVLAWIGSLQLSDGSFTGDEWGEVDTRFSYCAIQICYLLEGAASFSSINLPAACAFIASCKNLDAAYGSMPGSESHAGQGKFAGFCLALLTFSQSFAV